MFLFSSSLFSRKVHFLILEPSTSIFVFNVFILFRSSFLRSANSVVFSPCLVSDMLFLTWYVFFILFPLCSTPALRMFFFQEFCNYRLPFPETEAFDYMGGRLNFLFCSVIKVQEIIQNGYYRIDDLFRSSLTFIISVVNSNYSFIIFTLVVAGSQHQIPFPFDIYSQTAGVKMFGQVAQK